MTNAMEVINQVPKVLIADDDPAIVRFLANRCRNIGLDVQTAVNGLQALVMAGRNHPDVLIVDINMPELDGLSVSARLLQPDKKSMDIIVITASSYAETAERCESFGAYHVRKGADLWNQVRSALVEICPEIGRATTEEESAPPFKWERPRILIIDGNPEVGKFLSSRLEKRGVDTLLA